MKNEKTTSLRLAIIGSRGFPSTYGGYETLVRHVAPDWARRGHKVTVYCRSRPEGLGGRTWTCDGVRCVWTPGRDSKALSTPTYGATAVFDSALRGHDVALVLNVANGFYLPILKAARIPTVVNTDGVEWERGKWGKVEQKAFLAGARLTARFADLLVADSEAIARIWQRRFSVTSTFIPYGATLFDHYDDKRITPLGLTSRRYILVVARLIPENNVELTLDALELMRGDVEAVVVGSSNYNSPLEARIRDMAGRGKLRWLGHVHDQDLLTELWANCGAYVHGHSVGGTNPALLQALGAGAPTLALDTEFNREVIGGNEQLFVHDPNVLATRLEQLTSSPAMQQRFAALGKATVAERYSWNSVSDAYLETLERVR